VLTPLPPLLGRWLVVVVPPFSVSTPWAYRRFDELPTLTSLSTQRLELVPDQWPVQEQLINDLERAVLPENPQISAIKEALLRCGAEVALMSGSGSSVFGIFRDHGVAEQAASALADRGRTFLVEPLAGPPPLP